MRSSLICRGIKIIFSILLVSCWSCRNEKKPEISLFQEYKIKESPSLLQFSSHDMKVGLYVDSIVKEIRYIPLETNENSLIGYIDEIQIDDSLVFIADYRMAKSVFIFSRSGKYINKIAAFGQGNGEYTALNGIALDKPRKQIYLLDGEQGKIMVWNYSGEFLETIDLPFERLDYFQYDKQDVFYFAFGFRKNEYFNGKPYNLIGYDVKEKKIIASFFPYHDRFFPLAIRDGNLLAKGKNGVLYYRTILGNCVYKIDSDSLDIVCKVDFGEEQYPEEFYMLTNKELRKKEKEKKYKKVKSYLDFKNWSYIMINSGKYGIHCFYNKAKQCFYNDASHLVIKNKFIPFNINYCNEYSFYGWIPAELLCQVGSCDSAIKHKVVEDDNPILVFCELK